MADEKKPKLVMFESAEGNLYRGISTAWPSEIWLPDKNQWVEIEVRMRPQGWGSIYEGPDPAEESRAP